MRGVYKHVSPRMLTGLRVALEALWVASLRERAALSPSSSVRLLDAAIAPQLGSDAGSVLGAAPKSLPKTDV
jgi:hypothetical protein